MGYCVPAAIRAKIGSPGKQVVGNARDGAFMMTGMELNTAKTRNIGVVIFVFHDGELSQISQGQEIPYSRKVCTKLGKVNLEGMAMATKSRYYSMRKNDEISDVISIALRTAENGEPVIVDVNIDYTKRNYFTKGIVKTNIGCFPLSEKARFIGRALNRNVIG